MTGPITSAIFENERDAEYAVNRLRQVGFPDESIAVVRRHSSGRKDETDKPDNRGTGALRGLGVGAGVGALFGLSALVIPGVGPFIAAGSFLEAFGLLGSAAASGAIVGGAAGGLAGALMKYGVSEEDASYYEDCIQAGGIWIAVDTRHTIQDRDTAADVLRAAGGTTTTRTRRSETASPIHSELGTTA